MNFELIFCNDGLFRFENYSDFFNNCLQLLNVRGEMALILNQYEGKNHVKFCYNTIMNQSEVNDVFKKDYISKVVSIDNNNSKNIILSQAERFWQTVIVNENYLTSNKYLIAVNNYSSLLDVSDCMEMNIKGIQLMS